MVHLGYRGVIDPFHVFAISNAHVVPNRVYFVDDFVDEEGSSLLFCHSLRQEN